MTTATEILLYEHRLIERALNALEIATLRLKTGEKVYLRLFAGAAYFMNGYTEAVHHKKEEEALFPALVATGLSRETGPMAELIVDHAEIRRLSLLMKQMTERYMAGDSQARNKLIESALWCIRLNKQHMENEANNVYPMAEEVLSSKHRHELQVAFSKPRLSEFGEDLNEKYLSLVSRLEIESLRSE